MNDRARSGERAAVVSPPVRSDRAWGSKTTRVARALAMHQHRCAAALFALLVLVYLWPALIGGELLAPTSLLYLYDPWRSAVPPDLVSFLNPVLGDVPTTYYPWNVLARNLIHAGTFPAWNPYALGGTPFFANPEVAWFSPFTLPLWTFPLHYGLGVAAAAKLWMAGFGTYLLARQLALGFWAGMLAGISFALCSFDVVWLTHGVQVSVAVLLPWTLLLVERVVRGTRPWDALALAGVVAFVLTGGHPGTQLHVLAGALLYALVRTVASTDVATPERLRRLAWIAGAIVLGALLTAVTLLPAQQAAVGTAGEAARLHGGEFIGTEMSSRALLAALFPDWWGRPGGLPNPLVLHGPASYNERALYAGGASLVLALTALLTPTGWRRKAPFVVLGAIGAAVAARTSLVSVVDHLPLFDHVQNQRMALWFVLAVALLAGFGLQAVLDAPQQRRVWGAVGAALLAALVAFLAVGTGAATFGHVVDQALHRAGAVTRDELALASVLRFTVLVVAMAVVLLVVRRRPATGRLLGGLLVLLVAFDMLHFANGYQPIAPASKSIPPRTPAIAFLQRHADEGRIAGIGEALPSDYSSVFGLRDATGYDPPQPSMRFFRVWQITQPDQSPGSAFHIRSSPPSLRALDLLGARWLLAPSGTPTAPKIFKQVYDGPDGTILESLRAMPRAIAASSSQLASDEVQEVTAVAQDGFDPRTEVVLAREDLEGEPPPPGTDSGRVRVVAEENASVTLRATLPSAAVVVLDDAWAPGWSVSVDGKPARALRADVILRGVAVPAGTHTIVWSYRVPGLRAGLALTLLGLALSAVWAGWLVRRRRT